MLLDGPARKAEDNVVRIRMIGRHNNHDDKTNDDITSDDRDNNDNSNGDGRYDGTARKAEEGAVVKIMMMNFDDNTEDDNY